MSDNLINVASKAPMAIQLDQPLPDEYKEKPGEAPQMKSVVIAGAGSPDGPEVVTRGVDGDLFKAWMDANQHHPIVMNKVFREVSDEEADDLGSAKVSYGVEPQLEAAAKDQDNTKLAEKGTEFEEEAKEVPASPMHPEPVTAASAPAPAPMSAPKAATAPVKPAEASSPLGG